MFKQIDFKRIATAAVGALVLTTTFVGAAVAPARAVEITPVVFASGDAVQESGTAKA